MCINAYIPVLGTVGREIVPNRNVPVSALKSLSINVMLTSIAPIELRSRQR